MAFLGNLLIISALIITFALAVVAIVHGYNGMKMSKNFDTANKKVKIGYWVVSAIHMWAGILISVCYAIVGTLIIFSVLGGL